MVVKDLPTSEINELKKKLEENSDSLAFAPLADAYRKQGNLEEALRVCKKGLEKHPAYTSARVVLGRIYQDKTNIDDAAAEFKKVLELDPENLMAHSLLGSIFMGKKDFQAAIEEYQKILTLNPDDEETQSSLKHAIEKAAGEQKNTKSNTKKEEVTAERKSQAKESTASLTIAELYSKQGHYDKAIEIFQELLADDPQNLMLRQKLSEVVEKQQKEGSVDSSTNKIKKNQFTQPPDIKEDTIQEEIKQDSKSKAKTNDDSKFTNEDILQVMRRGGKDDAMVEEKKPKPPVKKPESALEVKAETQEKSDSSPKITNEQLDNIKGILAELSALSGIIRCLLIGSNANTIVSMGETSNNADLGKQVVAIFDGTGRSVSQLKQGKLQQVLVTAESGNILLVSIASFILIVLSNDKINLGLLRLALDSAIKKLDKVF